MMTRFSTKLAILPALCALWALAFALGCEKRPTGFDPNPNAPEGVPSTSARLIVSRNFALRILARDYARVPVDSAESSAQRLAGPTSTPLLWLFDGTQANSFELYRRDGGGKFERTGDYALQSVAKYVSAAYELFVSTDPAPGSYSPPSYLARGLVNGVASHQSPLTNESSLVAPELLPIIYNGEHNPLDSLFVVSWVGVPGAVGYWVHIYEKPIASAQRLMSALTSPIAVVTTGEMFLGYRAGNVPGGSVAFRLADTTLLTLKYHPPLLGLDYLVRISGVDAKGQVIAQTPGDLDSVAMSEDIAYLAPSNYSAAKTKVFFSLGGTLVRRQKLAARVTGGSAAQEPAPAGNVTFERNTPQTQFPYIAPFRTLMSPRHAGRH